MSYRDDVRELNKESRWTMWKTLPTIIIFIIVFGLIGFGAKSCGLIGTTVVERVVFENSFQYKTGMAQRGAILEANIIEIDMLLQSNPENRQELINQKSVLNAQLRAITINQ